MPNQTDSSKIWNIIFNVRLTYEEAWQPPEPNSTLTWADLELDSLDAVEMLLDLEDEGYYTPEEMFDLPPTVAEFVQALLTRNKSDFPSPEVKSEKKELESHPDSTGCLYWHIANWFSQNVPGTLVPEWCELIWPITKESVEELIAEYEKDTGRKVTDMPVNWSGS